MIWDDATVFLICWFLINSLVACYFLCPGPLSASIKSKRHEIKSDPTPFGYEGTRRKMLFLDWLLLYFWMMCFTVCSSISCVLWWLVGGLWCSFCQCMSIKWNWYHLCVCVCVAFVCFDHRFSLVVVWCFLLLVYFFFSLILHGYSCMVFLLDSTLTGCNCATFRNCAF